MLDAKIVVRKLGIPNKGLDIYSPEEVSEYLMYQYSGYELKETHYLGEVKDAQNQVQGWNVMFVLVRSEIARVEIPSASVEALTEPELPSMPVVKKLGRPKGS